MTDLSEFGGGVDQEDANPEDEINTMLSAWLRHNDRTVYWDRDRTYGNGRFDITTRRRPDLVIESKYNNYAVEVKRTEDSGNIHDGGKQVFEYWKDIVDGEAVYKVGGKTIEIDAVLLATDKSPQGHLFHNWRKKDVQLSGRSGGAKKAADIGEIPRTEHAASETLIRMLHRFGKWYDEDAEVGIGGLLSSALDGDEAHVDSSTPAALYYVPGGDNVQNWQYIPFYLGK